MRVGLRVGVVGAGIVGLATAYELARTDGTEVRCYEQGTPMAGRSIGATRVFRIAHRDPVLVRLAVEAAAPWHRWERAFGRRLLEPTGTVVSGGSATAWRDAMASVGAPARFDEGPDRRLPTTTANGPSLLDPGGAVIRVDTTGSVLATALGDRVRGDDPVSEVVPLPGGGARIAAASGVWDCDVALVLAGAGTPVLADRAGIRGVPTEVRHHHRFTFPLIAATGAPPCWLDQSESWRPGFTSYQHRTASGRWAVGGSLPERDTRWELGADEAGRRAREVVIEYVRATVTGVRPEVLDVVHCSSMALGDGIATGRSGDVLALWGDNLMKFAPVLGALLADSARQGRIDDVLAELPGPGDPLNQGDPAATVNGQPSRTAPR